MKDSRRDIHRKIFFFTCLAIAFFIPVYGRLLPPLIGLLVLNWLISGSFVTTFSTVFKDRKRLSILSFAVLYLIYLAGMLWSDNLDYGTFDLEVKLSLFIFPFVFATTDDTSVLVTGRRWIGGAFVAGLVAGSLILLGHAVYLTRVFHVPDAIYYSNLSWFFHPGYYALYLSFGVAILFYSLLYDAMNEIWYKKVWMGLLILYFILFIFMLSSKAGLLGLIIVVLFFSLLEMIRSRRVLRGVMMIGAMGIIIFFGIRLFPYIGGRISQAEKEMISGGQDQHSGSSTSDRKLIIKGSFEILKKHWLTGVGTGDVKDSLLATYQELHSQSAFQHKLNAHNQYLQTWIAIGIPGILTLMLMLFIPGYFAWRKGDYLYFIFLTMIGFNIALESMFETQAGVVFYSFTNCILFILGGNDRGHEGSDALAKQTG